MDRLIPLRDRAASPAARRPRRNAWRRCWSRSAAVAEAARRASLNGAPVALVARRCWVFVVERADVYDRVCAVGWESLGVVEPMEAL